jgi:hypothetical protein
MPTPQSVAHPKYPLIGVYMLSRVMFSTISNLVTKWRITHYDLEPRYDTFAGGAKGETRLNICPSKIASNLSIATGIMLGHMDMSI